ncbi:MAG TPA: AMP-binding protein [Acidimicrobiia bacterium]
MIEWLSRVDPARPFLRFEGQVLTYGAALREVEGRRTREHRVLRPTLTPDSVLDLISGLAGGGVTVVSPEGPIAEPDADHPTADLVVYTSGTSGPPKGVRLTIGNMTAAASASALHLGHGPDDDWLLAMPLHHVGGISILVRQMHTGGAVTMLDGFEPGRFADAMRTSVSMVSVVPTMLRRIVDLGPFPGLRAVLVGGGASPDGLLETAWDAGMPVLPTYGMTETFGQVATLRPGAPLERKAHPLPGVELRIEPDGRIAVRGEQVSPGYLGEPDRPDPWFTTNDIGTLDAEGAVRVLGRADTMIVTGGENVAPEPVEAEIRRHPDVIDVVVVGVPDPEWGEIVTCFYVGSPDGDDLASWAAERLAGFMVPKRWTRLESIPRTHLGKPDRRALSGSD